MIRLTDMEFEEIVTYMREHYGINLQKKKVLIECRMSRELEKRGIASFTQYLELLRRDRSGKAAGVMVDRLTTNYTYFMRESSHFDILNDEILPELFAKRYPGICSIWIAGCSTGEEVYSIAMLLQDYRKKHEKLPAIRILATDISEEALKKAELGIYPKRELEKLPEPWQHMYCRERDKNTFEVDGKLRYNVRFRVHNLMDPVLGTDKFDLILCRNVMIYFDKQSRKRLIKQLENCLDEGGYLMVGHAELLARDETTMESVHSVVYRK